MALRLFLLCYAAFVSWHTFSHGVSGDGLFFFVCGILLSAIVHAGKGLPTMAMLLAHMCLEWRMHIAHSGHYTAAEQVFHAVHAVVDICFLFVVIAEVSTVTARSSWMPWLTVSQAKRRWISAATLSFSSFAMVSVAATFYQPQIPGPQPQMEFAQRYTPLHTPSLVLHKHDVKTPLEQTLLGGILGCALMHARRKKSV